MTIGSQSLRSRVVQSLAFTHGIQGSVGEPDLRQVHRRQALLHGDLLERLREFEGQRDGEVAEPGGAFVPSDPVDEIAQGR